MADAEFFDNCHTLLEIISAALETGSQIKFDIMLSHYNQTKPVRHPNQR